MSRQYNCLQCGAIVDWVDNRKFWEVHGEPEPYCKAELCEECYEKTNPGRGATRLDQWKIDGKKNGWQDEDIQDTIDRMNMLVNTGPNSRESFEIRSSFPKRMRISCRRCGGSGNYKGYECRTCDSDGWEYREYRNY